MRVPDAFDGALAGLAAVFLAVGFAAGFFAFGDLALAAGFLALGEAAFFGLFFGAALGLAGDFLGAGFLAGDFLATVFFLAGDLAFEAGFAGDFLAALGDLRSAVGPDAVDATSDAAVALCLRGGLGGLGRLRRGLGALLRRRLLGRGPVTRS